MRRFVMCVVLVGGGPVLAAEPVAQSWDNQCYAEFKQDVSEVSGPSATDCGFLPMDASARKRAATLACAKEAVGSGKPFKFGYASVGDDSSFCDVAIRRADGQLVAFEYDADVTGQMGTDGNHAVVWTSRCETIEFKPGTIGPGSFFAMGDCREAPEIFSGLASQK